MIKERTLLTLWTATCLIWLAVHHLARRNPTPKLQLVSLLTTLAFLCIHIRLHLLWRKSERRVRTDAASKSLRRV